MKNYKALIGIIIGIMLIVQLNAQTLDQGKKFIYYEKTNKVLQKPRLWR